MKKISIVFLLLSCTTFVFSQDQKYRLGINGGIASPAFGFGSASTEAQPYEYHFSPSVTIPGFLIPFVVPIDITGNLDCMTGGGAKPGPLFSIDLSRKLKGHFRLAAVYRYSTHAFKDADYLPVLSFNIHIGLVNQDFPTTYTFTGPSSSKPWQLHSLMLGPEYEYVFKKGYFDLRMLAGATYFISNEYTSSASSQALQPVTLREPARYSIGFSAMGGLYYSYPLYARKKTAASRNETLSRPEGTAGSGPKTSYTIYIRPGMEYFYGYTKQNRNYDVDGLGAGVMPVPTAALFRETAYHVQMYMFNLGLVLAR